MSNLTTLKDKVLAAVRSLPGKAKGSEPVRTALGQARELEALAASEVDAAKAAIRAALETFDMVVEQVRDFTEDGRRESFDALLQIGSQGQVRSTDDEDAEVAADIAVQTQERLRIFLQRVAKMTGTDWTPPAPNDLLSGILRRS